MPPIISQQLASVGVGGLALSRQIAGIVGVNRMVNDLARQIVPDMSAVIASSVKLPSARDLLEPAIDAHFNAVNALFEPWRDTAAAISWPRGYYHYDHARP